MNSRPQTPSKKPPPPPNKNTYQKPKPPPPLKGNIKSTTSVSTVASSVSAKEANQKKASTDNKKGIRAFLGLTPEERIRRKNVSKKIQVLLKQRNIESSVTSVGSIDSDAGKEGKPPSRPKRFRRPIEKLIKRIKIIRRQQSASNINIHRRRLQRASFMGAPGTRKEVATIHDAFTKVGKKTQPQVGWNYDKKERRLLLGFRHRKLSKSWNFFGAMKNLCPRRIKPNSHLPDVLFFVFNLSIFISCGFYFGLIYGSDGFIRVLSDTYAYELFLKNEPNMKHEGVRYWIKTAPLDYYGEWYHIMSYCFISTILLGLIGVYLAEQKLHLAYVVGMVVTLTWAASIAVKVSSKDYCEEVNTVLERLLNLLVNNYYETVPALDTNGKPALGAAGMAVQIRTYKAANLMDRIQRSMHCCGVNSLADYTSKSWKVPPSCCTPLWNLNPHCANAIPTDKLEYRAKLQIAKEVDLGCLTVLKTMCINIQRMMGSSTRYLNAAHWLLFLASLIPLILQARQIRQLRRPPHLRITAGSISQSLQASGGNEGSKSGAGGVRAVVEASKFTEKQQERLQQVRRENLLKGDEPEDSSSESTEESSDELQVHTVNFGQLKHLQQFVDTEDKIILEMPDVDKTVEGFAGRFNILANKTLQNYVSGIFSTTYQNETNAGLEAIAQTLERQFAQHTTDYNWRKLLTKPKPKPKPNEVKVKDSSIKVRKVKSANRGRTGSTPAAATSEGDSDEESESHPA